MYTALLKREKVEEGFAFIARHDGPPGSIPPRRVVWAASLLLHPAPEP